ncbi:hypothetical protein B0H19DRAFT_1197548 [Mycena capillaripes]|nr:hypothetical protein B0H19DRAFT_1197548 [Mycena capillaripes]
MAANEVFSGQPPNPTDTDRLIGTLQACFSGLLKEQKEQAESLRHAVEALKLRPPATDKKTAFWNAYKTLADEHDRELLQRYSTDLDTSLIFAGLFSAVDSAFIIQIQPAFQLSDPNSSQSLSPPLLILIAQSLLYVSLGSALLAALLAVLGKQWLMSYSAAGERGTIETRGLERQRKLDGLRKWKFDTIMQMFPLLLQFGLFLFATGLSVFLWRIDLVLALIVLGLTSLGSIAYIFLLASAAVFPNSPFQTPLAPLVARLFPSSLWIKSKAFFMPITISLCAWMDRIRLLSHHIHSSFDLLPRFSKRGSTRTLEPPSIFGLSLFEPSPEVPAVSWVLETSTDPNTVTLAADLAADLEWPSTMDVGPQMTRLRDHLFGCFHHGIEDGVAVLAGVREGSSLRPLQLGRAYGALRCISKCSNSDPIPKFSSNGDTRLGLEPDLRLRCTLDVLRGPVGDLLAFLPGFPYYGGYFKDGLKWALHVLPSLLLHPNEGFSEKELVNFLVHRFDHQSDLFDLSSFADYLFLVNALLSYGPPNSHDVIWIDKSQFVGRLLETVLRTLASNLETGRISTNFAASLLHTIRRLGCNFDVWYRSEAEHRFMTYNFCSSIPPIVGWVDVLRHRAVWVHRALKSIDIPKWDYAIWNSETEDVFDALLLALHYYGEPPTKDSISPILWALSKGGRVFRNTVLTFLQADVFLDDELRPILQNAGLWSSITRFVIASRRYSSGSVNPLGAPISVGDYISLGNTLSQLPAWQPDLLYELCSWVRIFFDLKTWTPSLADEYSSALVNICQLSTKEYHFQGSEEQALGLTFTALANAWELFDFSCLQSLQGVLLWLDCSISVVLRCGYSSGELDSFVGVSSISTKFATLFSEPLRNSLINAAAAVRREIEVCRSLGSISEGRGDAFQSIATILNELSKIIPQPADAEHDWDWDGWYNVKHGLEREFEDLERLVGDRPIRPGKRHVHETTPQASKHPNTVLQEMRFSLH